MTSALIAFLRARLDEDAGRAEAARRNSGSGEWRYDTDDDYVSAVEVDPDEAHARREHWMPLVTEAQSYVGDYMNDDLGQFIAANDPARVLDDVESKRQIVDHMEGLLRYAEGDSEVDHYGAFDAADRTLEWLARPYRDHPDFNPAWLED